MAYENEGPELLELLAAPLHIAGILIIFVLALAVAAYDKAGAALKRTFGKGEK